MDYVRQQEGGRPQEPEQGCLVFSRTNMACPSCMAIVRLERGQSQRGVNTWSQDTPSPFPKQYGRLFSSFLLVRQGVKVLYPPLITIMASAGRPSSIAIHITEFKTGLITLTTACTLMMSSHPESCESVASLSVILLWSIFQLLYYYTRQACISSHRPGLAGERRQTQRR